MILRAMIHTSVFSVQISIECESWDVLVQ